MKVTILILLLLALAAPLWKQTTWVGFVWLVLLASLVAWRVGYKLWESKTKRLLVYGLLLFLLISIPTEIMVTLTGGDIGEPSAALNTVQHATMTMIIALFVFAWGSPILSAIRHQPVYGLRVGSVAAWFILTSATVFFSIANEFFELVYFGPTWTGDASPNWRYLDTMKDLLVNSIAAAASSIVIIVSHRVMSENPSRSVMHPRGGNR